MEILNKIKTFLIHVLEIPFLWTSKISIPSFMILVTLFSILILILIDPIASAYIYFALNKKEGMDFKPVTFASAETYKAAIEVLTIITFIYLVKTDAGFIDKFIKFLEVFKSAKNSIIEKIKTGKEK
ncbi:MAG: hypothetical protein IPL26_00170 [Leptospiraceae bacterium]|nr:hypothetical protein [Leptospiraceae bacterium]